MASRHRTTDEARGLAMRDPRVARVLRAPAGTYAHHVFVAARALVLLYQWRMRMGWDGLQSVALVLLLDTPSMQPAELAREVCEIGLAWIDPD